LKPVIAITAGHPSGIGPEITVKSLRDKRIRKNCAPLVIGDRKSLERYGWNPSLSAIFDTSNPITDKTFGSRGKPAREGGLSSYKAVRLAIRLALNKKASAIVTAPINKESWHMAGIRHTGHTELLADMCKCETLMSFVAENVKCALVTNHYSLKDVASNITGQKILKTARILDKSLRKLKIKNPEIGVCALNPHCGENGLLGNEETKTIIPAIKALNKQGIRASGPLPSDSAWSEHSNGKFDALLCMYHDQALTGIKLASESPIVHWTCGLPFIRTSPTHGTAFDIAGKNMANPESMIEAILFAIRHSSKKQFN
jgi:4-hydroxythreonine-4-phosphate dehydrogenase